LPATMRPPLSSLEAVGRSYPRDAARSATQRGRPCLPLGSGFAGCRHAARRQFCSEGRLHLVNTSYARPAGPQQGLGRAAPGLPGRPYIPAFIFFFFGDYGHQSRKNLTGGPRLIKNPPRLAVRSPWRAFLLIICSPREEGELCNGNKERPGQSRLSRDGRRPWPGPPKMPPPNYDTAYLPTQELAEKDEKQIFPTPHTLVGVADRDTIIFL